MPIHFMACHDLYHVQHAPMRKECLVFLYLVEEGHAGLDAKGGKEERMFLMSYIS